MGYHGPRIMQPNEKSVLVPMRNGKTWQVIISLPRVRPSQSAGLTLFQRIMPSALQYLTKAVSDFFSDYCESRNIEVSTRWLQWSSLSLHNPIPKFALKLRDNDVSRYALALSKKLATIKLIFLKKTGAEISDVSNIVLSFVGYTYPSFERALTIDVKSFIATIRQAYVAKYGDGAAAEIAVLDAYDPTKLQEKCSSMVKAELTKRHDKMHKSANAIATRLVAFNAFLEKHKFDKAQKITADSTNDQNETARELALAEGDALVQRSLGLDTWRESIKRCCNSRPATKAKFA